MREDGGREGSLGAWQAWHLIVKRLLELLRQIRLRSDTVIHVLNLKISVWIEYRIGARFTHVPRVSRVYARTKFHAS